MAIQTPANNATLTAAEVANLLVQPLEQESTFLAAGPQIIDTAGPLRVPRIASGASAGFVAAGAQIPDSNVSFDEIQMLPSTLKGIKVLSKLSNELIRQATHTVGALDKVVQNKLVSDAATVLDAALWDGTGASDTIKGVLRQTNIATGTLDLTNADSLIDGWATAMANKVRPTHWVMTSQSFAAIRKLKTGGSSAQYLIDPTTIQNGTALQLFGLPVILTDFIPNVSGKARVGLVDFSKVVVARDENPTVTILDQTYGDYDTVGIRVTARFDVAVTQPKAVTLLTAA
ncbi:HK97 family phage major capsid protein [Mycolicibacterium iranicum]|uniref:HK97 family phage major capsid protein n=1 Tax=Mycolicibacterium iranicum TaxID=912594 RepID=A0A839Q8P4_MYCIR|nr:phage major capsid protein [Mycolicibacterium iranicum]MBB2992360.1 HK97 family phage major capsid protein [Mycolicibacterium iranicum]